MGGSTGGDQSMTAELQLDGRCERMVDCGDKVVELWSREDEVCICCRTFRCGGAEGRRQLADDV